MFVVQCGRPPALLVLPTAITNTSRRRGRERTISFLVGWVDDEGIVPQSANKNDVIIVAGTVPIAGTQDHETDLASAVGNQQRSHLRKVTGGKRCQEDTASKDLVQLARLQYAALMQRTERLTRALVDPTMSGASGNSLRFMEGLTVVAVYLQAGDDKSGVDGATREDESGALLLDNAIAVAQAVQLPLFCETRHGNGLDSPLSIQQKEIRDNAGKPHHSEPEEMLLYDYLCNGHGRCCPYQHYAHCESAAGSPFNMVFLARLSSSYLIMQSLAEQYPVAPTHSPSTVDSSTRLRARALPGTQFSVLAPASEPPASPWPFTVVSRLFRSHSLLAWHLSSMPLFEPQHSKSSTYQLQEGFRLSLSYLQCFLPPAIQVLLQFAIPKLWFSVSQSQAPSDKAKSPVILSIQERNDHIHRFVLEANVIGFAIVDFVVGLFLSYCLYRIGNEPRFPTLDTILNNHYLFLNRCFAWLEDNPLGIKINRGAAIQCTRALRAVVHLHEYVIRRTVLSISTPTANRFVIYSMPTLLGAAASLAVVHDLIQVISCHLAVFSFAFGEIYRFEVRFLGALWRLFRGKKWNVLRHRTDTMEYDSTQLLLGTILFVVVLFLFTTTLAYNTFFSLLYILSVYLVSALVVGMYIGIRKFPYGHVFYSVFQPKCFPHSVSIVRLHQNYDLPLSVRHVCQTTQPPGKEPMDLIRSIFSKMSGHVARMFAGAWSSSRPSLRNPMTADFLEST
jgi:N-acetylglucosaminyl transferase component (Gpi1)